MTHDMRLDRRYLDLVVFADQLPRDVGGKPPAATFANIRRMVAKLIGIVRQPTVMRLVSKLRTARTGILTFLLLVRRRRLGRCAGVLLRPLKPKHQLDQLLLAQLLQISPIHPHMDSEIETRGKGVGSYIVWNENTAHCAFPREIYGDRSQFKG